MHTLITQQTFNHYFNFYYRTFSAYSQPLFIDLPILFAI